MKQRVNLNKLKKLNIKVFKKLVNDFDILLYFSKKNLFKYISYWKFISEYVYMGYSIKDTSFNTYKFLLGSYHNLCVININYVIDILKINLFFIIRVCLFNFLSIFIINENFNFSKYFKTNYINLNVDNFFGLWWGGMLSKIKFIKYHKKFYSKSYFLKYRRLPGFTFFSSSGNFTTPLSVFNTYKEFKKLSLLNLFFLDTNTHVSHFDNWILWNSKNFSTNWMLLSLLETFCLKLILLKKKKFLFLFLKKLLIF